MTASTPITVLQIDGRTGLACAYIPASLSHTYQFDSNFLGDTATFIKTFVMKSMEKQDHHLKFQRVLEHIQEHFGFLFQHGYEVSSALFTNRSNDNWMVLLTGDDCLIQVHHRDGRICLALNTIQLFDMIGLFDLHDLVEWMGDDENLLHRHGENLPDETEQLRRTARLLEKHMDDILILFQKIHLGMTISGAGQLITDQFPVLLFYESAKGTYATPA